MAMSPCFTSTSWLVWALWDGDLERALDEMARDEISLLGVPVIVTSSELWDAFLFPLGEGSGARSYGVSVSPW